MRRVITIVPYNADSVISERGLWDIGAFDWFQTYYFVHLYICFVIWIFEMFKQASHHYSQSNKT